MKGNFRQARAKNTFLLCVLVWKLLKSIIPGQQREELKEDPERKVLWDKTTGQSMRDRADCRFATGLGSMCGGKSRG